MKVKLKKVMEIYEEPIALAWENYFVKHVPALTDTEKKSYKCDFCDKAFSQNKQLIIHMATHLRVVIQKLVPCPISMPERDKNSVHKSSQGGTDLSYKNSFKSHLRTHTREKTYQCSQCAETFSNNINLIKHQ
ncbi:unnamed protein product, partial [Meganyctiphanes norvegica]